MEPILGILGLIVFGLVGWSLLKFGFRILGFILKVGIGFAFIVFLVLLLAGSMGRC